MPQVLKGLEGRELRQCILARVRQLTQEAYPEDATFQLKALLGRRFRLTWDGKPQHSMREACACAVTSGRTNYLQSYLTRPGSVVGDNAVNRLTPPAVPARSRPVQPLDRPQPRRHRPRHQRPPPWNCSRPTTHPSVRPSAKTESAHSPRFPPLHHLRPRPVEMKQATAHVSALPSQPRP